MVNTSPYTSWSTMQCGVLDTEASVLAWHVYPSVTLGYSSVYEHFINICDASFFQMVHNWLQGTIVASAMLGKGISDHA